MKFSRFLSKHCYALWLRYGSTAKLILIFLFARVMPGVVSVAVLFMLADWLSRDAYGVASTLMVTVSASATFLYGPILQPALVQHAERSEGKAQRHFEYSQVTKSIILSALVVAVGLILAPVVNMRILAGIASFGTYTVALQILRSRLAFIKFGVGSTTQSLAFLTLCFWWVRPNPSVDIVIEAFAWSYAIGLFFVAVLAKLRLTIPRWRDIRESITLGSVPTLSNLTEAFFSLGTRYLLLDLDRALLGVFAFSLDLAQRSVAVFINIATFGVVPYALKSKNVGKLWQSLTRGAVIAAGAAAFSAVTILFLGQTGSVSALESAVYDPSSFIILALAVTVHRIGKMIVTPVSIRIRRPGLALRPLIVVAPLALSAMAVSSLLPYPYVVEIIYSIALITWTVWGYFLVRRRISRFSEVASE